MDDNELRNTQVAANDDGVNNVDVTEGLDAASRSLVDALGFTFKILKVIMLVCVLFYFGSGLFRVQPEEVALKVQFGKVLGTGLGREVTSGFAWSLPWPIHSHIKVPKDLREVTSEFWYQMTAQEKLEGISKRAGASLIPGKDNFVITGDENILHVAMLVRYRIANAYQYVAGIEGAEKPDDVPERELLECLVDSAVIQAAGQFTVDELIGPGKPRFKASVTKYLSESLNHLDVGLTLGEVLIKTIETPRQVTKFFDYVRNAHDQGRTEVEQALGDYRKLLVETAGESYEELTNALVEENKLREESDPKVSEVGKKVTGLLENASGSVREIISDAQSYRTRVVETAKADAEYFKSLLPKFLEDRQVVLTRLLLSTVQDLFSRVEKRYVPSDVREIRVIIDRDPLELAEPPKGEEPNR